MLQTSRYLNAKNKTDIYLNFKTKQFCMLKTIRYLNAKKKEIFECYKQADI